MKNLLKVIIPIIIVVGLFTSCGEVSKKIDEKINKLTDKAERLDSIVTTEIGKVVALDSLINLEGKKVEKLDSVITNASTKIDSIANAKMKLLENIVK